MQATVRKKAVLLVLCLLMACTFAGCKPSKKKVLSSSYYKELNKKYKKLKKEKDELEKELEKKDEPTEDEKRAIDYLEKIARDRTISLEVGYADNMKGGELITTSQVFNSATAIAKRADLTHRYTPEEVAKKYGPGYEYLLYDEDNAVYEILVYDGDYVVFADLPNNVYYAYNASALGDAFLHYRDGYPNSRLLHRLADSALVTDDKYCYENDSAFRAANYIRTMDRKNSSRKKAEKAWKKACKNKKKKDKDPDGEEEESGSDSESTEYEPEGDRYTFYHHGNEMVMTLYDKYICIKNMDGKETWYQVDPKEIKDLKKCFVVPEDESRTEKNSGKETTESDGEPNHEKEIEEESSPS